VAATFTVPCPRSWCDVRRWTVRILVGFAAFLVLGNLMIVGASVVAQQVFDIGRINGVEGINNLRPVDGKVWRGAHPSKEGYRSLAAAGVTVVVDLRAEHDAAADDEFIERLGIEVVHLPIRDGQTPSGAAIDRFVDIVEDAAGPVFVHCGAGVGRAGAMSAAYLEATGQAGPIEALIRNFEVGPPSLEQIVFAGSGGQQPDLVITTLSRTLDAPRRIWHNL
jgi:protein-tyrosine phosphatase